MKPSEILLAAADDLRTNGWCQHAERDGRSHCAVGAIRELRGSWNEPDHARAAEDYLRRAIGGGRIDEWNDTPGRTADEVIEALHAAAVLAESEGR